MPALISTPNLTKNGVKGWETRLIYSQNIPQQMDLSSTNYFDAVNGSYVRGALGIYPPNYWSNGKTLRLKASLNYGGSGARFNISTRLSDGNNSISCRQNNGNDHDFANGNAEYDVPISLEITYVSADSEMFISGFYQYEWGSYANGGSNSKVVYVPMNFSTGSLDFTTNTQMNITIDNQPVQVNWLTIEEIG